MDDDRIIEWFLNRDERAIEQTAAKYGSRLREISYGITGDRLTAEECENDTYMEAWNTIPPQNPTGYFYAYLARIVRHLSVDVCRKNKRQKRNAAITELTAEMEECIPSPDDTAGQLEAKELGEAITRYLRTLSEDKQTIFMRRYYYLDSIETIAHGYGISRSKVKMTLLRCRKGLKEHLEKEGYPV
ncbi:MAG: sigma-70 family RNA polymerase sigma factor [Clostridia bacterium]|nr:sigma-70 family RNA polymerase sigma factor [Clostridia bacterium]